MAARRLSLAWLAVALAACGPAGSSVDCRATAECPGTTVCIAGRCLEPADSAITADTGPRSDAAADTSAPSDASTEAIPAAAFCDRYATAVCSGYLGCCPTATGTLADCRARWTATCASEVGPLLVDPVTGYDEDVAASALVACEELAGSCSVELRPWLSARSGLYRAFRGTIAPGGECALSTMFPIGASLSCSAPDHACLATVGARSFCSGLQMVGGTCEHDLDCMEGLHCDVDAPTSTCAADLEEGAACMMSRACATGLCSSDGRCAPMEVPDAFCPIGG